MKRQPMGPILGPWFKGMDDTPPDAQECAREVVAQLPEVRQRGRWWPLPALDRPADTLASRGLAPVPIPITNGRLPARGFTMFSALKFITAVVIVALFGGILLTGMFTIQQSDEVLPAAAPGPPSSESSFPTGAFVSIENAHLMLEFGGDGTAVKHDLTGSTISFTYAVDGDVYTWLTSEHGKEELYGQATYAWDLDDGRLSFELLGEDGFPYRMRLYTQNTFELVEDPQAVVIAYRDLDVGEPVRARLGFVAGAEAGPDTYASILDIRGRVAAVPISKGQAIAPELLEPEPGVSVVRSDILPGVALTVEAVEPGVFRVVSDGIRDLAMDPYPHAVAGKDGGVWLFDEQGFSRLGTDVTHGWPNDKMAAGFDVAPDGTVWTSDVTVRKNDRRVLRIRSFDGETWTIRQKALDTEPLDPFVPQRAFTVTNDGAVWASWADPEANPRGDEGEDAIVARFGAAGWEPLARTIEDTSGSVRLFVTDDGEVWADPGYGPILRYADGGWESMSPEGLRGTGPRVDIGRDGTVWHVSSATLDHAEWVDGCPRGANCLMRYDGTDWQGWARPDGFLEADWAYAYPVHAAPHGSAWVAGDLYSDSKDGGVARFDGAEWRHFLTGRQVWAMDVADDGTVWLVVDTDETPFEDDGEDPHHLYVITPEAVAATE